MEVGYPKKEHLYFWLDCQDMAKFYVICRVILCHDMTICHDMRFISDILISHCMKKVIIDSST